MQHGVLFCQPLVSVFLLTFYKIVLFLKNTWSRDVAAYTREQTSAMHAGVAIKHDPRQTWVRFGCGIK